MTRLLLANLTRGRLLSAVTLATVVVAFVLFGLLLALQRVFDAGVEVANADRLIVANRASIMQSLPLRHEARIAELDGVAGVARYVFFGAFYQRPSQQVMTIATDPAAFIRMMPELSFADPAAAERWRADRTSIAVGRRLAEKYGWQVGDLVPLYSFIYPRRAGGNSWAFRVAAVFDSASGSGNTNSALIHYDYFDEARAHGKGSVGWFNVRVDDARRADEVAAAIDRTFANSPAATRSATEEAFTREFMRQVGDFNAILGFATLAVGFTLMLVGANAVAHSVDERLGEFATLKALGWSDARVGTLVVAESVLLALAGAALGAALAALAIPQIAARSASLGQLSFAWRDLPWLGLGALAFGLLAASGPAWRAFRVDTATRLARAA